MTGHPADRYVHEALCFRGDDQLVATAIPFLEGGLAAGDATVVVVADANVAQLRSAFDGERIAVLDQAEVYRRPAVALETFRRVTEAELAAGAGRVRLLGEIAYDDDPLSWAQWAAFEAVCNRVLAGYPLWNLCLYDAGRLPRDVLVAALRTHPGLAHRGRRRDNARYVAPEELLPQATGVVPDVLESREPTLTLHDVTAGAEARQRVRACLDTGAAGATRSAGDLIAAMSEVVANALQHGRPPVTLRLWVTPERLLVAVTDTGAGIDDPFVGFLSPTLLQPGVGLWLARQLSDSLVLRRQPGSFTVVLWVAVTA